MRFDHVDAEPQATLEAVELEERIRVGERQHAPVDLGAKVGAFFK